MNILSDEFLENMMDEITNKVDRSLRSIENQYAVRSRYLSKKNACIYADITPPTLEKWLAQGLQISKPNGTYRIDTKDIDKFILDHRI